MNNILKEILSSNNILSDASNIVDSIDVIKFSGSKEYKLKGFENHGYIIINVSGVTENTVLTYNDVEILSINCDCNRIIPIKFLREKILKISGCCDSFQIYLYGCTIV